MATISKLPSGKYQAKIRRKGFRTLSKTFIYRRSAVAWARKTGSEVERSVYIDMAMIVGIVISVGTVGNLLSVFGITDTTTSAKAGEYLFYLGIPAASVNALFLRRKSNSEA